MNNTDDMDNNNSNKNIMTPKLSKLKLKPFKNNKLTK